MPATHLVLTYPADLSAWGREQLRTPWLLAYLRRTLGTVAAGESFEVFLDVGCCGDTLDVPLGVDRVDGDGRIGPATTIEYVEGPACGVAGGWRVQSRAGPSSGP